MTRWAHRHLPRSFAPRTARRYTKQRGPLLWTTGTSRNTAYCVIEGGVLLLRPLVYFYSGVDTKLGHVLTNQHVVDKCESVTVGDSANKQVTANVLETDRRNDLALLKISSMQMASAETKSLIRKLGIRIVPLSSNGLLRSEDVELGERVLVAGYPYGDIFSNTIKVTKGIVSANRGFGDDTGQFQMDAAVQPGNSGGPIYDENGNIVGVVIAQLNKMKFAKAIGSIPENVNFGIKASTVRQFLTSSGLPTKWSKRSKRMSTKQLAKIAKNQTVMVVCHP